MQEYDYEVVDRLSTEVGERVDSRIVLPGEA